MSKENVTIVQNAYDTFNRGDIQAVFGALDPEVEFYQSEEVPWGGRYHGHKEVGAFLQKLKSSIESKFDADQFVDSGDHVVVRVKRGKRGGIAVVKCLIKLYRQKANLLVYL